MVLYIVAVKGEDPPIPTFFVVIGSIIYFMIYLFSESIGWRIGCSILFFLLAANVYIALIYEKPIIGLLALAFFITSLVLRFKL